MTDYKPPNSHDSSLVNEHTAELLTDFLACVQESGGTVSGFTWRELKYMSAAKFITLMAQNMDVKFTPKKHIHSVKEINSTKTGGDAYRAG